MKHLITVWPGGRTIEAEDGSNLYQVLRGADLTLNAPCGGRGTCGKCKVRIGDTEHSACQTVIDRSMEVTLPDIRTAQILSDGSGRQVKMDPLKTGYLTAFDIGTTTVVCYLLEEHTGKELAAASMLNPQSVYGADVITRLQEALNGQMDAQCAAIREGLAELNRTVCEKAGISPSQIGVVSVVANPAMQQLFFGIPPKNLVEIPFAPVFRRAEVRPAKDYLPECDRADILIVPDISGYVGADTIGCALSTGIDQSNKIRLLVDIGTNGEMLLGNRERMTACSTAAGPALEGAHIRFGMRGAEGAIDHVRIENGSLRCSVIGGGEASGICGSGLIDAIAAFLELGLINGRGRIQSTEEIDGQRIIRLSKRVYLTQEDIREVQLAKGAIAAGIELMADYLGITLDSIEEVLLAGAFGSFLDPDSACRIGLLPSVLSGRIKAVGNAAGSGARMLACSREEFRHAQRLADWIEFIELADLPGFRRSFAKNSAFHP